MKECCKVTNPLRRDGTSQPERFPLALAEDYVRIDERSPADLLNFTRQLATQFNYYNGNNAIDGDWAAFFQEDLSFLLARISAMDLDVYRDFFEFHRNQLVDEFETNGVTGALNPLLVAVFRQFLGTVGSVGDVDYPAFPLLMDQWHELLPETGLFGDGTGLYSYRDEVDEGRGKTKSFVQNLQIAFYEAQADPNLTLTDLQPEFNGLEKDTWGVFVNPGDFPGDSDPYDPPDISQRKYFTSGTTADHIPKLIDLFQACFDTLIGVVRKLQERIPQFLEQSFAEYAYHEPQNGLFLAFVQLMGSAQDHINSLGRKHLLYHYRDVLRFSEQSLVPDQAVLIFQLRKGVDQYKIDAGTELKAGKDVDGNSLFYAVDREVVVNQAALTEVRTVFVERELSNPMNGKVQGVYAAPIANSADGQGGELDEGEPKWNLFGERQGELEAAERTMVDGELGFAVASPLLVLREGNRTIHLTLELGSGKSGYRPGLYLNNHQKRYAAEADLLNGLQVQFSSEEGMLDAELNRVFIAHRSEFTQGHPDLSDWNLPTGSWVNKTYLCLEINIDDTLPAFVPYDAELHGGTYATLWPLLKISFAGQSDLVADLNLPPAIFGVGKKGPGAFSLPRTTFQMGKIYLYEGRAYIAGQSGKLNSIKNNFTSLDSFSDLLDATFEAYDSGKTYSTAAEVSLGGEAYRAADAIGLGESPADEDSSWELISFGGSLYPYFERTTVAQIHVKVAATEMENVYLENDTGRLKAGKPFRPLGSVPVVGSRFYVGSKEIFGKKLSSLDLTLVWKDPPSNLGNHYDGYEKFKLVSSSATEKSAKAPNLPFKSAKTGKSKGKTTYYTSSSQGPSFPNSSFKVQVDRLLDGDWEQLGTSLKPLFHSSNATLPHTISFTASELSAFDRSLNLEEPTAYGPKETVGFLRMELAAPSMGFGHKRYPKLLLQEAMLAGDNDANTTPAYPNEPHTPILKEFKLSYSSEATLDLTRSARSEYDGRVEQFFHVHPFGNIEEHPAVQESGTVSLLPDYARNEAYLYLGFDAFHPPSSLSVLFQLAEGSGDPEPTRNDPVWSYLASNRWQDLEAADIVADSTRGLLASGVIQFNLPKSMTTGNTVLDGNLHWLRARVGRNSSAIDKGLAIIPQAVQASFLDQDNNPEHLRTSLPSGTITGLRVNDASVKKVRQPYASDGGKLPEQSNEFLTRVSERLRHKYRSINIWDYERMVLEEYPAIYKVKCLNHTLVTNDKAPDNELAPGNVTVVCIPDLRNKNAVNPFEPRTPVHLLDEIAGFLGQFTSPWVDLWVRNPRYETLQISCTVGFYEGRDPGYYLRQLDTDLKEFLSPWAFDYDEDIVFGGQIHRSQIIHFIEQREYIDFVVNLELWHDLADGLPARSVKEAVASTARSILVSSLSHSITAQEGPVVCTPTASTEPVREKETCCTQIADLSGC